MSEPWYLESDPAVAGEQGYRLLIMERDESVPHTSASLWDASLWTLKQLPETETGSFSVFTQSQISPKGKRVQNIFLSAGFSPSLSPTSTRDTPVKLHSVKMCLVVMNFLRFCFLSYHANLIFLLYSMNLNWRILRRRKSILLYPPILSKWLCVKRGRWVL